MKDWHLTLTYMVYTSSVLDFNMAHTVRCFCSNLQSSPIIELHRIANKSKALTDLYRSLLFKGCDNIDNSVLEYIKFYQLKYEKFCVVTVPKPSVAGASEMTGFEVRFFHNQFFPECKVSYTTIKYYHILKKLKVIQR